MTQNTLTDLLHGEPMPFARALPLAIELANALVRHGDHDMFTGGLTPADVLIEAKGFTLTAQRLSTQKAPQARLFTETRLPYLAPEQLATAGTRTDLRADLYSLGVILYQCLTGRLPFLANNAISLYHRQLTELPVFPKTSPIAAEHLFQRIVLKLLAKDPDDRYQSVFGLLQDLSKCSTAAGETEGPVLPLGQEDRPRHLRFSPRLHDRRVQEEWLHRAFEDVRHGGLCPLILVTGEAGVGKTALVAGLERPVVAAGGSFLLGKFDQSNRDSPYFTPVQAFGAWADKLLGGTQASITSWRERLLAALGTQAPVMTGLLPGLSRILGEQAAVASLPPDETRRRLHAAFRRFVRAIATSEHPLVVFFDDLQWADAATLELITGLLSDSQLRHFLVIGAFRDAEVAPDHPLWSAVQAIRQNNGRVEQLTVNTLSLGGTQAVLADTLVMEKKDVASLASLLQAKTGGNPFFLRQYLEALTAAGLLHKPVDKQDWRWDIPAIETQAYARNVVNFVLDRLRLLPVPTQRLLQLAACMGHRGIISELVAPARQLGLDSTHLDLAIRSGILVVHGDRYAFLHDRLQQAAIALFPDERPRMHLALARSSLSRLAVDQDRVFDILSHYHAANDLLDDSGERETVAGLCLAAARKAQGAAASVAARDFCRRGLQLLAPDSWTSQHRLCFDLHLASAENSWRCGDPLTALRELHALHQVPNLDLLEQAAIERLLIEIYTTQGRMNDAVERCRVGLAALGINLPSSPSEEAVREAYESVRIELGQCLPDRILQLPALTNPLHRATLNILAVTIPAAIFTSSNFAAYLYSQIVLLSLKHGNGEAAAAGYMYFAMVYGSVMGQYHAAYQLGQVGYDLARRDQPPWRSRIYVIFGNVISFWTKPLRASLPYMRAAFPAAEEAGDLAGACYCWNHFVSLLLALGKDLETVLAELDQGLRFVANAHYSDVTDILLAQQRLVLALQGKTRKYSGYANDHFDDTAFDTRASASQMTLLRFWHHTRILQASFILGRATEAVAAGHAASDLAWSSPGHHELAEHHFYHALALAETCPPAAGSKRTEYLEQISSYQRIHAAWAANCPENFAHKKALIDAELARLEGRELDALRAFELAVRLANREQFVHHEALAQERLAIFCATVGLEAFGRQALAAAIRCYESWGAVAKVEMLRKIGPTELDSIKSQAAPLDLDLATIVRAGQAISSELAISTVSEQLMRTLIESSGAERGLLISCSNQQMLVEAVAESQANTLNIRLLPSKPIAAFPELAETILNYAARRQATVLIEDARSQHRFTDDPAFRAGLQRSVLCLPILRQRALVGLVYLENRKIPAAFTPEKVTVLELLASQASISLEIARLYTELAAEEEKWRVTLESMSDGLLVCDSATKVLLINETAKTVLGLTGREFVVGATPLGEMLSRQNHPDARSDQPGHVLTRALLGEAHVADEWPIRRADTGQMRTLRINAAAMRDKNQAIVGAVVVLRDVTERNELDRLKDDFLRSAAHELKTPLMIVKGFFELFQMLAADLIKDDELRDCIGRMHGALGRLDAMIGTLMDVALAQLGKLKLKIETFDLGELASELVEGMALTAPEHQLKYSDDSTVTSVRGDRIRLGQVISNLLGNALRYSPDGGAISLTITHQAAEIVVAVADHGVGIPLDRQERLFERFYRAHAETPADRGGMGVGLFLSKEILAAHGGRIWFTSEAGKGSTFSFALPALAVHLDKV